MTKRLLTLAFFLFPMLLSAQIFRQQAEFTRYDTLRGSITPERGWWDVTYYHLDVKVDTTDSTISGTNTIQYKVTEPYSVMQIDLQKPMQITKVWQDGESLRVKQDSNYYFVELSKPQNPGDLNTVTVEFGGKPTVAIRPPWDGGITWARDSNGLPFIANSNQGDGASIWWPNKDHPKDEVDSVLISTTFPANLMNVSNGRLRSVTDNGDGTKTTHWFVSNPINNYGININIGDYVHFEETYDGEAGPLDMDYWVLRENHEKAISQFADAPRMMEALEYWFGPYPFYEDSYKLVEAPYLGMEHQSSITYGNKYENGYLGRDLSGSGWGLKFDFIIIHESGHEWFANNITYQDVADMWIHESFTNYSESLYLEYHFGKEAGNEYVRGTRLGIQNQTPIIGSYDVWMEGSGDMYSKGGNMLHTLRQVVNNDSLWRATLRGLNKDFYHQTVTTEMVEGYLSEKLGMDLQPFFDQYLRDIRIPTLEYAFKEGRLLYRWANAVPTFDMPVDVMLDGKKVRLEPVTTWKVMNSFAKELMIDPDFYVGRNRLLK